MNLKITVYKRIYSQSQINMASTNNMYSVTAFIGDEFVFQSDTFQTKEDAKNLMNLLKSSDTGDITFQYYKHFPRGRVYGGYTYTEENYITEEIDYTETTCNSMTIYSHDEVDNTFILEPSVNNEYYGQHGFLGAKWSEDYLGWILTPSQYKLAMSYGASVSTNCEEDDNNHDYPSMTLYLHDEDLDSYILEPPKDSVHYGQPDFFDGYWSQEHEGWIYSSSQADELIELGVTVYQDASEAEEEAEATYEGCTIEYYKNGLLMTAPKSNSLYGEPYLGEGFWNKKLKGWVFKTDQLDTLISQGAQMVITVEDEDTVDEETYTFDGFAIEYYKNGLLMTCPGSNSLYGEPYLGEGFWNKKLKGWVFKTDQLDTLISQGAQMVITVEDEDTVDEEVYTFDGFTIEYYKNGLLMTCPGSHSLYGEPYLGKGFWNKKLKGWVYKTEQLDDLVANGAKLIKQEVSSASASTLSVNFKKMKFYDYGKGYLLVPNKSCKSKGEKYFHDGYWMPKNNGWFFRTRFCEFVENCGAKYMGKW